MPNPIRNFTTDTDGAVTVDWVVLTAVAAAFGVIVTTTLGSGTDDVATNIGSNLTQMQAAPLQDLGYSQ